MNRPHSSSSAQRPQPTLRVLGRLPYVAPASTETPNDAEPETTFTGVSFAMNDSVRRGLIYGLIAVAILGVTWYLVARKTDKSQLASKDSEKPWEVHVPRPDAPEAPAWGPYESGQPAVQSAQAQQSPGGGPALGSATPTTKSPLGFDLPAGNGWGQPPFSETTTNHYPNGMVGPAYGTQQQNTTPAPQAYQVQATPESLSAGMPAGSMPTGSPFPTQPSNATQAFAPTPPWANAAGQSFASQPSGFAGDSQPVFQAGNPAQSPIAGAPTIVRNPYVTDVSPSVANGNPGTANPAAYSPVPAANLADAGQYTPSNGTAPNGTLPAWSGGTGEPGSYQAAAYLASRPGNEWGVPPTSTPQQASAGNASNPQFPASWNQTNAYGSTALAPAGINQNATAPATMYGSSGYPQESWGPANVQQPSNWNTTPPVSPAVVPGWNLPASQPTSSPNYPGATNPYSPSDRSNTMPASGQDSQVVPATYANPANGDPRLPQGSPYPTTHYPSTGWTPNASNPVPNQYPVTGQTGYGLYPSTTLR